MRFTWDEAKRKINLNRHEFDFKDVGPVFSGLTFTFEDDRFAYDEYRFVTLGVSHNAVVSIVHTETEHEIHIISFRRATKREIALYRDQISGY